MTLTKPASKKIIVGISGGVDSAVAATLLKAAGFEVIAVYIETSKPNPAALEDAAAICRQLDIELVVIDTAEYFQSRVIDPFVDAWVCGLTPNPCVFCNPLLKFELLFEEARHRDALALATGHYAQIVSSQPQGRLAFKNTGQGYRDQSYFLYRLEQEQLASLVLPLAGYSKSAVRALAAKHNLKDRKGDPLAEKKDSQDICFVTEGHYAQFIAAEIKRRSLQTNILVPGPVLNLDGQTIGSHPGLVYSTIGQRKGFSVQTTERLYVIKRDVTSRSLIVGPFAALRRRRIRVKDIVYSGLESFAKGQACLARIRSSAPIAPCNVYPHEDTNSLTVVFSDPVSGVAPGQSLVFYRDDQVVLAGGVIADNDENTA